MHLHRKRNHLSGSGEKSIAPTASKKADGLESKCTNSDALHSASKDSQLVLLLRREGNLSVIWQFQ